MSRSGSLWQVCACKDCFETAPAPKEGGKVYCEDCRALGCPYSNECQHKDLALHEDLFPDSAFNDR